MARPERLGLAAALLLLATPLGAQQVSTLGWMAGCWRQLDAGVVVDEVWLGPQGGTMVGVSRTVVNDVTRSTEHMVIRTGTSGGVVFEASPSGQPPAAFLSTVVSDTLVIFENLTHDFPQQIRYTRAGSDSLVAVVSGTVREKPRAISFRYARSSCPGT